jgi:hypothetical protein
MGRGFRGVGPGDWVGLVFTGVEGWVDEGMAVLLVGLCTMGCNNTAKALDFLWERYNASDAASENS